MPVSIALSSSTCLTQLLDDDTLTPSICQVIRAQDMQQGVIEIVNAIWLLYNIREINYYQAHSTSNGLVETIPISEPAILRTPCEKTIVCMDVQLPAATCIQRRIIFKPSLFTNFLNRPTFIIPIKNMTKRLLSTYKLQAAQSAKEIMTEFKPTQSKT
ncbi:unnamed protein product [Didymodactylos carnosus]|uniref:Uncharacterized protein n=1 Tax=Didymodactylos carnosus TaxID=1234261 RepID=A0A813YS89_9BILA|nr:unnamed protein product [Didymodactylos carnosus]CAF0912795.1 unnamed protein product [Didymodactylos carnosus]CAF3673640.1 unnamed protein product [Didymodactylos carnosus]CAF3691601.1 unnamed protein product [Didymodactylos carnosus]